MSRFGMTGRFVATPGNGPELVRILLDSTTSGEPMDGCLLYVVATDIEDADIVHITEVWTDAASHAASLEREDVRAAITKAMPLIQEMDGAKLMVRGGVGIAT